MKIKELLENKGIKETRKYVVGRLIRYMNGEVKLNETEYKELEEFVAYDKEVM